MKQGFLTTHVLDTYSGTPGNNIKVDLYLIKDGREKITSVFVLLGSINLPIIKYSVDWWNTLHQPASISKLSSPSIEISILIPLLFTTIAFTLIFLFILSIRLRAEINIRKSIISQ